MADPKKLALSIKHPYHPKDRFDLLRQSMSHVGPVNTSVFLAGQRKIIESNKRERISRTVKEIERSKRQLLVDSDILTGYSEVPNTSNSNKIPGTEPEVKQSAKELRQANSQNFRKRQSDRNLLLRPTASVAPTTIHGFRYHRNGDERATPGELMSWKDARDKQLVKNVMDTILKSPSNPEPDECYTYGSKLHLEQPMWRDRHLPRILRDDSDFTVIPDSWIGRNKTNNWVSFEQQPATKRPSIPANGGMTADDYFQNAFKLSNKTTRTIESMGMNHDYYLYGLNSRSSLSRANSMSRSASLQGRGSSTTGDALFQRQWRRRRSMHLDGADTCIECELVRAMTRRPDPNGHRDQILEHQTLKQASLPSSAVNRGSSCLMDKTSTSLMGKRSCNIMSQKPSKLMTQRPSNLMNQKQPSLHSGRTSSIVGPVAGQMSLSSPRSSLQLGLRPRFRCGLGDSRECQVRPGESRHARQVSYSYQANPSGQETRRPSLMEFHKQKMEESKEQTRRKVKEYKESAQKRREQCQRVKMGVVKDKVMATEA